MARQKKLIDMARNLLLMTSILILLFACESNQDTEKVEDHTSALENFIDEPRERARDVKSDVEERDRKTMQELDKILE